MAAEGRDEQTVHQHDDGALFAAPQRAASHRAGSDRAGSERVASKGAASKGATSKGATSKGATSGEAATVSPAAGVARVCVESVLPHLDRPFDYAIPPKLAPMVQVGTRVRVRFAGRLINAVVIELADGSEFGGKLAPINSAGASPSYTQDALELARAIARRYGGSLWDVLRLMAPPRVASVETRDWATTSFGTGPYREAAPQLQAIAADAGLDVAAVAAGARIVWEALPDSDQPASLPAAALVAASVAVAAKGLSSIVVLPDARAVARVEEALRVSGLRRWTSRSGGHYTVLDADHSAATRYGAYLAGLHGHVGLVIGTRSVVMQPVPELGLVTIWDDSSSVFDEPHAPYPHARTIAAMRASFNGAGTLLGAYAPGVDAMALVAHGWAEHRHRERAVVRECTPTVDLLTAARREAEGGSGWHWMPGSAWQALTKALPRGPVAIVVPRAGYVRAVTCGKCGEWAHCNACGGTLSQVAVKAPLVCVDCAAAQSDWHCSECHSNTVKQVRQGVERIAEQVRVMAKSTPVHVSAAAGGTLGDDSVTAGIVVATPGALPAVQGGYAHVVVVGADAPAAGGLGAELHAIRWWLNTAALVRPRSRGGAVSLVGELPDQVRQAIVAWAPGAAAHDAYTERATLLLPPARRTLAITGAQAALTLALSVSVEGERIERHPDLTVVSSRDGVTLLMSRRVAPAVVDAVRAVQLDLSKAGQDA